MASVQCAHILGKTGTQCKKQTKTGTYCHLHTKEHSKQQDRKQKKQEKKDNIKVDTCPICLDDDVKLKLFSCSHGVCDSCRGKLRQDICPVCRADIKEILHEREKTAIKKRLNSDNNERIQADRMYVINVMIDELQSRGIYIRPVVFRI